MLPVLLAACSICLAAGDLSAEGGGEGGQKQRRLGREHASGHDGTAHSVLGRCSDCHVDKPALPLDHGSTIGTPLAHCRTCHAPGARAAPITGSLPLDHIHALAGIDCVGCHSGGEEPALDASTQMCRQCHGPQDALVARTKNVLPTNPHTSPHEDMFEECSLCHYQHSDPIDICATCHDFGFAEP